MKLLLFVLIAIIAISTTASGLLMISDTSGTILNLPVDLLAKTPFRDFFLPGLFLMLVVGGVNLVALFQNITGSATRYNWSMAGGFIISAWIIVQMLLIQSVHWLHIFLLAMGLLIILISYHLKGKWAA